MKFSKLNVSIIVILIVAMVFVFAQGLIPPGLNQVFGPYPILTCSDTDGLNIYQQGFTGITYSVLNATTNSTYNATLSGFDYCLDNNTLAEGLCGSWVTQNLGVNYNGYAFLPTFNCSSSNTFNTTYQCLSGACVPQVPMNNTNLTLPDLTVNLTLNNIINVSTNGTVQFLINYTQIIRNIGNAPSPIASGITGTAMFCATGGSGGGGPITIPALTPGQAITQPQLQTVYCYGTFNANVTVDNNHLIPELNENNNQAGLVAII